MTPLSYPLRSTTFLSAFTLCFPWALLILSYPHSNYLFSLSSLSISCLPPFFSLPIYSCTSSSCHLYLHFLILHSLSGLHFPFYSSHPCPLLSFSCQSFDYSSASQAVCINNTAPVAHMDRRRVKCKWKNGKKRWAIMEGACTKCKWQRHCLLSFAFYHSKTYSYFSIVQKSHKYNERQSDILNIF